MHPLEDSLLKDLGLSHLQGPHDLGGAGAAILPHHWGGWLPGLATTTGPLALLTDPKVGMHVQWVVALASHARLQGGAYNNDKEERMVTCE